MYPSAVLAIGLLFAPSTFALPASTPTDSSPSKPSHSGIPWQITQYIQGCSPGGCTYRFHVAAPARDIFPPIDAECAGSDQLPEPVRCLPSTNGSVSADLIPQRNGLVLRVNQEFSAPITGGVATYWTDGFRLFPPGKKVPAAFKIYPNQTYAIA